MENLKLVTNREFINIVLISMKRSKREPKGSKRDQKDNKNEPKGSQGNPKVSHLKAQACQKWGKGDQNVSKNRSSEKGAKRLTPSQWNESLLGISFHQKPMNKSIRKSIPNKKNQRKMMRKLTYILMIFGIAPHEELNFLKKVNVR